MNELFMSIDKERQVEDILNRRLQEQGIGITEQNFSYGDEFDRPPNVRNEIGSLRFDSAVHELKKILKIYTDFKIEYIPPTFEEKEIKVLDIEATEAAIRHCPWTAKDEYYITTVYVLRNIPDIRIIHSGQLREK